jgi:hypothetical protein
LIVPPGHHATNGRAGNCIVDRFYAYPWMAVRPWCLIFAKTMRGEHSGTICRVSLAGTMELLMLDNISVAYSTEVTNVRETPIQPPKSSSDKDLQRAQGGCRIVAGGSGKETRIMDVCQQSPIRVLFLEPAALGGPSS